MTGAEDRARLVMALRKHGVSHPDVLAAMERVPREAFVPDAFRGRAHDDDALPIGHGQTISQPAVVGYMTQQLELGPRMRVLEIGTGSGYQSAVLAALCRRVYSVERCRPLLRGARARFAALDIGNVVTRWADGAHGWPEQAPFDRIAVTAAAPEPPPALLDQLAPEGIMVLPVGAAGGRQDLLKYRKRGGDMLRETLWPVSFVPLLPDTEDDPHG